MGLIDRLQDDQSTQGAFGRALSMRKSRSAPFEASQPADVSTIADDAPSGESEIVLGAAIRSLLKELQTQRHFGITTPSHLFSLMHRHLHVRRGAILIPHRDGGMVPIATAGIDRTSGFRVRLLEHEIDWLGSGRSAIILDDRQRETFTKRLSRADARHAPRVGIVPFTHIRSIVAALVIFDSPILYMDPNVLDVIVGALSESAGRLLFDGRQRPMDRRNATSIFTLEHMTEISRRLAERSDEEEQEVVIIDVDLAPLVATIVQNHPHLDRSRLLEDLLETTALLTEKTHSVVQLPDQGMLLVGNNEPSAPPDLLVHLLTVTLASLFGCTYTEQLRYSLRDINEYLRDV